MKAFGLAFLLLLGSAAGQGFVTRTFPARLEGNQIEIDLAGLPANADVRRAVLRVSEEGHKTGAAIRLVAGEKRLELRPPEYQTFEALPAVRAARSQGVLKIRVEESGGLNFASATLE